MGVKIEVQEERPILVKILVQGELLNYLKSKKGIKEPYSKTILKLLRFMMFLDRYAMENKRVSDLLKLAYRRARELGVLS